MTQRDPAARRRAMDTTLAHADGDPFSRQGAVNPPVYRASTILYPTVGEYEAARDPARRFDVVRYGQLGTPTTFALEQAVAAIEGGYRAMLLPSGLAAVTATLQALLSSGDHVRGSRRAGHRRGGPCRGPRRRHGQHVGEPLLLRRVRAGRGCLDSSRDQVLCRPLGRDDGDDHDDRAAVRASALHGGRPGTLCERRRCVPRPARAAHVGRAARAPPAERGTGGRVATHAAGGCARALPRVAGRPRLRDLEA